MMLSPLPLVEPDFTIFLSKLSPFSCCNSPQLQKRSMKRFPWRLLLSLCFRQTTEVLSQVRNTSAASPPLPTPPSPKLKLTPEKIILSVALGFIAGAVCSLLFACLIRFFVKFLNGKPILRGPVVFSPNITSEMLHQAIAGVHTSPPSPSAGKPTTVALTTIYGAPARRGEIRRLQGEMEKLSRLNHVNLMKLQAYMCEGDRLVMACEHMPKGNLEEAMGRARRKEEELPWEARLRIAVGMAKGLEHLHFRCSPQILHMNLTPENVMLNADMEPKLTNYGLMLFQGRIAAEYCPPELRKRMDLRWGEKSDVYSYGRIVGEMMTGREGGRGVKRVEEGRWALDEGMVDREVGEEVVEEMVMVLKIALVCVSELPEERPSSDELVLMLTHLHSF